MTPAQLALRRTGIGGSDVAAIVGESQWGCPLSVWNDKRGVEIEEQKSKHLERGQKLEDFVAAEWAAERRFTVRRMKMQRHPDIVWALANVDREIIKDIRGRGVLECKIPSKYVWLRYRREGLPAQYILQGQWYLFVLGLEWGAYAIFNAELMQFADEGQDPFEFRANPRLMKALLPRLEDFWRQVEYGPAPDKLDRDDPRCARCKYRPLCHDDALEVELSSDTLYSCDPTLIQHIRAYREFGEIEKAAAEEKKAAVEAAAALVKGKTSTPAGSITYVPGSPRFSMPLLEKHDKDLAAKLRREYSAASAPYWRITPKKEG
jgi:putative phage-type endonuclease